MPYAYEYRRERRVEQEGEACRNHAAHPFFVSLRLIGANDFLFSAGIILFFLLPSNDQAFWVNKSETQPPLSDSK